MKERKKKREKMAFLPLFWPKPVAQKEAQSHAAQPTPGAQPADPTTRPAPDPRPTLPTCATWRPSSGPHLQADASLRSAGFDRRRRASRARAMHAPASSPLCATRAGCESGDRPALIKISQKRSQSEIDTWLSGFKVWEIVFSPLTLLNCILALFPTL